MAFIPIENYTISTSLSMEQIRQRLLENPEPQRDSRYLWRNPTKPYTGTISEDGFRISRIIRYRNSFLPAITGQCTPGFNPADLIVIAMFAIGYVFMTGLFKMESSKAKKLLADLLDPVTSSLPIVIKH